MGGILWPVDFQGRIPIPAGNNGIEIRNTQRLLLQGMGDRESVGTWAVCYFV